MMGAVIEAFQIMMDKKEAVAEITERNLNDKWKRKFDLSDMAGRV